MSITKPKLSTLVSGQLPEFVREDYKTFVSFLEAYYEYLETQIITDFESISDVDTTLDSFIKYFKSEVALNFPETLLDDRFLLPKLKELYISKGSVSSYQLLFRLLYNKEVIIKQPETQMLRVSDGKWIQDISIFVQVNSGSPDSIVGKYAYITSTDRTNFKHIKVFVDRYQSTSMANVYEIFITGNYTGTFDVGDILNYSTVFVSTIVPTTKNITIIQPGINFRVGQVYSIGGSGTGSIIRIESITNTGGIRSVKFIDYGAGYTSSFNSSILASDNQLTTLQNLFTITGLSATVQDSINQISDQGFLSKYDYASSVAGLYVDASYCGDIVSSFINSSIDPSAIDPAKYAILAISLGSLAKYPGYYRNTDGFISNDKVIQDGKYYQAFSYALEIDELFDSYKSVVKNLIHPAGLEVFGEYSIKINFDASASVGLNIIQSLHNLFAENLDQLTTESDDILTVFV
jgi:hypothetical protein